MQTKRFMTWLTMAIIALPQSALAAHPPTEPAMRQALSTQDLAAARGGAIPTAKIGGSAQYGYLTVFRNVGNGPFCGLAAPGSTRIVPVGTNRPECVPSIPLHSLSDTSVDVLLGGMAANITGAVDPGFNVYVNGVAVPAGELGLDFEFQCPATGTAVSQGSNLTIYDCNNHTPQNFAQIPTSRFVAGLNTITVFYQLAEAAFQSTGSDMDTRIIFMN